MTSTGTQFDGTLFRQSAARVLECLTNDEVDALLSRYYDRDALLDLMVDRGRSTCDSLGKRKGRPRESEYDTLAAALLSARRKPSVQENLTNIIGVFDDLSARQVPIELAVPSRLLKDSRLTGLLVDTGRLGAAVQAEAPDLAHPMFVTMVAAALLHGAGPERLCTERVVCAVLARANDLAAAHRSRMEVVTGPDPDFPVLGNADIVGQVSAYRVAVAEAVGQSHHLTVADVAGEVSVRLRRALTRAPNRLNWRGGDEPDVVVTFQDFAKTIGAGSAEVVDVFRCLHRELTAMSVRTGTDDPIDVERYGVQEEVSVDRRWIEADELTGRMIRAVYAGAGPRREVVTRWLTGVRRIDDPFELPFLIDRMRQVVQCLRLPSQDVMPDPAESVGLGPFAAKVRDAVLLGYSSEFVAAAVLPPLWSSRSGAIKLVQSKIRLFMKRSAATRSKAAMVAAVVVRGPVQVVLAVSADRSATCGCGARGRRNPVERAAVPPAVVCPHRTWVESGAVEDYSTLAAFAEYPGVDATRMQLTRYTGPWEYWVKEAFGREG